MRSKFYIAGAASALTLGLMLASPASAEDCILSSPDAGTYECSVSVEPVPLPGTPAPAAPKVDNTTGGIAVKGTTQLPVTGAETLLIVGLGAGLVLAGGAMVVRSRRVPAIA